MTLLPIVVGIDRPPTLVFATCTTALSWMFVSRPMTMPFTSPRNTAPYQMELFSPIVTSPITDALGAMNPTLGNRGTLSYTPRTVLCFEISSRKTLEPCIVQPTRSRTWPVSRSAVPRANITRDMVFDDCD